MRPIRLAVVALLAPVLLAACFTGERPTFSTGLADSNDPAVAAVLTLLDAVPAAPLTATYSLLTKFGNVTTPASVAIAAPGERSITIGTIRFLLQAAGPHTCDLTVGRCSSTVDDAQVSDKSLTHDFYAASAASRLRQDSTTMVRPGLASTRLILDQTATCVEVAFTSGTKIYCALDNGLLAYQDTPDLQITMLALTGTTDPAVFNPEATLGS